MFAAAAGSDEVLLGVDVVPLVGIGRRDGGLISSSVCPSFLLLLLLCLPHHDSECALALSKARWRRMFRFSLFLLGLLLLLLSDHDDGGEVFLREQKPRKRSKKQQKVSQHQEHIIRAKKDDVEGYYEVDRHLEGGGSGGISISIMY